jgi:thymidylate synthase (FAD)
MKLVKPSYEILSDLNTEYLLKLIELAGRTCYKSEDKMTEESAKAFIKMILGRHHESVIEHASMTVKFIIDRGVSHEIVRHRLASFSQESTRYCNYSKDKFDNEITFVIPCWMPNTQEGSVTLENFEWNKDVQFSNLLDLKWAKSLLESEKTYLELIAAGWQPQQARAVLPNSLKTEIVVTANFREWRTIFKQRTATAAHPQMREVMIPLLAEVKKRVPVVFDDIIVESQA